MGDTTLSRERRDDLATFVRDRLADDGIPGASVAVVRDGELVFADGFGSRNLAENRPATAETLYGVGSVTKSFAALAIMQLQEDGLLDVDDPVGEYVPFDLERGEPITVHDLLTHSSGLPSLGVSEVLISRRAGLEEKGVPLGDREDFHHHVDGAGEELAAEPGERFFYCNSGYSLLGEVVEERSGKPFATYVEDEILAPLGMERSTFRKEAFEADPNAMTPYFAGEEGPEPTDLPVRELSYAAGGLVSSVEELANYLRMNLNGGTFDGVELATPESLDAMHEGHVETDAGPYGYGWRRREVLGRTLVGHSGSIGVSTAYVGFVEEGDVGVAVACNTSPGYSLRVIGEGVLAVILGRDPESDLPFFARRERLSTLTGEYESYRGIKRASVTRDGELLRLEFEGALSGDGTPLVPAEEEFEFYSLSPSGERRTVEFDADGSDVDLFVDRWRLHKAD